MIINLKILINDDRTQKYTVLSSRFFLGDTEKMKRNKIQDNYFTLCLLKHKY